MRLAGAHVHDYRGIHDLRIPLGRTTVVIGPNGAGKSSVLEALGYVTPEDGAVERLSDPPPVVSWYLAPDKADEVLMERLLDSVASAVGVERARIERLLEDMKSALCVKLHFARPATVAIDLFRYIIDRPATAKRARAKHALALLAAQPANDGLIELGFALEANPDDLPAFLDLGFALQDGETCGRPHAISMVAVPNDISVRLLSHVRSLAETIFSRVALSRPEVRSALDSLALGVLEPARRLGVLEPVLSEYQELLRENLPSFVRRDGLVSLPILSGADSPIGKVEGLLRQLSARLQDDPASDELCEQARRALRDFGDSIDFHLESEMFDAEDRKIYPYSRLGTGTRRWICGAADEAARELLMRWGTAPLTLDEWDFLDGVAEEPGSRRLPIRRPVDRSGLPIRLIDEPMESVEGRRHGEVLAWLRTRQRVAGETLVLSSHQASVLKAGAPEDLVVVGLARSSGNVRATPFGHGLLTSLDRAFAQLGISREELMFGARGLLMVEGSDDLAVLQALYGDKLHEHGVFVHVLGGHSARAIADAFKESPYRLLGLPAWALLDSIADDEISEDLRCVHDPEHNPMTDLGKASQAEDVPIRPIAFEPNDIIAGIDRDIFAAAFPGGAVPPRRAFIDAVKSARTGHALKLLIAGWTVGDSGGARLNVSRDVIGPALGLIAAQERGAQGASPWLRRSMTRFFEELEGRAESADGSPSE